MSDFMKWLYQHYVRPELEAAAPGEYEMCLSVAENNITPCVREDFEKAAEYIALQAFQLGLRAGRDLCC